MVQALNTMQMTTLEYIMMLGYLCLLLQLIFVFLTGPLQMNGGVPALSEEWSLGCSIGVVLVMLISLLAYWSAARRYARASCAPFAKHPIRAPRSSASNE